MLIYVLIVFPVCIPDNSAAPPVNGNVNMKSGLWCAAVNRSSGWKISCPAVFVVKKIKWCHLHFTTNDPCLTFGEFEHKIGYNSANARDTTQILASNRILSGYSNSIVLLNFYHDQPWLPWQRNLGENWLQLGLYNKVKITKNKLNYKVLVAVHISTK